MFRRFSWTIFRNLRLIKKNPKIFNKLALLAKLINNWILIINNKFKLILKKRKINYYKII